MTTLDREVRYQGAVLKDGCILILKHINHRTGHVYWWLPGGGQMPGETVEACVAREIREETCLEVRVERLLFETGSLGSKYQYQRYATYLCTPISGEAAIGTESESSAIHSIMDIGWYPLWDESQWEPGFYEDYIYPFLKSIQAALR